MKAKLVWGATGLGLVALFVALGALGPAGLSGPDICLFHRATGVACPACGMTRAAAALASGDLGASLRFHPLFVPVALALGTGWALWGAAVMGGRPRRRELAGLALATGALLVAVWAARLVSGTLPP